MKNKEYFWIIFLTLFIPLFLTENSFGWGFLTHIILNKKAYEQATITEPDLEKNLFKIAGMSPDIISAWVANPFNLDPNKHRYDYGHNLIDKNSLKPLDVNTDSQLQGIPLFGIKMIKAYDLKRYDNPYGLPKRFNLINNLNPHKNRAFGWVAHQIGDRYAHGPDGFANAVNVYLLPLYVPIFLAHAVNEMAVDAIMLLDYPSEFENIKHQISSALIHEASILYYNQVGEIGPDMSMNKKDHILMCDFVLNTLLKAFSRNFVVSKAIATIYKFTPGLKSYYETAPNDYRTWFNPAVEEVKNFLTNPSLVLNQDIDFSTDGLDIPPDPPNNPKKGKLIASNNQQQEIPFFDVYRAFIASVGEEAEKLGAFTIDIRIISEESDIPGSKTYEISGEITNQEAFNTALNNVIQEWLSYPSDIEDPIKLSQKIFAKFINGALTKKDYTFLQIIRYSEDVFPPIVQILSPDDKDIINGEIKIVGTVKDDDLDGKFISNFKSYKVEVGYGENPTNWQVIGSGTNEVQEGNLATWNTKGLSGIYTIKVTAEDTADNISETKITVFIGEPNFLFSFGQKGNKNGEFNQPSYIAIDLSGNIYITDTMNHRVQKFTKDGNFILSFGEKSKGSPSDRDGEFNQPKGIAIDNQDNIYIADSLNHRIQKFDKNGNFISSFGKKGQRDGEFNQPIDLVVRSWKLEVSNIFVADSLNHRIQVFDKEHNFLFAFGSKGNLQGQFNQPKGLAIDSTDNIYIADTMNNRVQMFDKLGNFVKILIEDLKQPQGVFIDKKDNIYISDTMNNRILKFDKFGNKLFEFGSFGSANSQFNQPIGILVKDGLMYIVDTMNHRMQVFGIKYNITASFKKRDNNLRNENKNVPLLPQIENVYVLPNPYNGGNPGIIFRYKANGNIQRVIFEVYNLSGRLIDKFEDETIDGEKIYSGVNRLANGVYIYSITISDGRNSVSKIGKLAILK